MKIIQQQQYELPDELAAIVRSLAYWNSAFENDLLPEKPGGFPTRAAIRTARNRVNSIVGIANDIVVWARSLNLEVDRAEAARGPSA